VERAEREHLNALTTKVALLERQLAALYKHLGLTPPADAPPLDAVAELLRMGNKLEAIKVYRQQMDCDLATAKAAVDQLAAQLGFV
jgi:ribosomal protein L7/L12